LRVQDWVQYCQKTQKRGVTIYAYANSHYAGFGPATVEQFRELCLEKGIEIPPLQLPMKLAAGTLFAISWCSEINLFATFLVESRHKFLASLVFFFQPVL